MPLHYHLKANLFGSSIIVVFLFNLIIKQIKIKIKIMGKKINLNFKFLR